MTTDLAAPHQLRDGRRMFLSLPPAPKLSAFVHAYWFIEDLSGEHAGRAIRTSPLPVGVLSVNVGRPNATEDGDLIPRTSLLGLQTRVRTWRSCPDTYFVMVMLTIPGLLRIFPSTGSGAGNKLLDLGAVMGDAGAAAFASEVAAIIEPPRIAAALDGWLIEQMARRESVPERARLIAAYDVLRHGGSVGKAASTAHVDRRQLHRLFLRHLGIAPKELGDLERIHRSLKSVQRVRGDAAAGFSDQAHQIRSWRRRLGVTPAAYRRAALSPMAAHFSSAARTEPAFYL
ncbi:helix-turn-helix domain-containing protein (plasmid) [Acuticoccus sp. MNP-M23]|uniref:helix-turn-helix domain-containing protein n=1 Tax=Acuticoccus sp. MNP-M23 TaxID=3072793 RepID=UPI002815A26B|nr:helix-turn-helix domain-containing protein [Acuticoccus sp. MNP-M23]WMS45260.1 helix-turn-helix domain-containing protein [Acuticoccus sp. MNP-M23]